MITGLIDILSNNGRVRALVTAFFLVVSSSSVFSQESKRDTVTIADTLETLEEASVENLLEQAAQNGEESPLLDRLQQLEENPLELNDASAEELQVIPGVTSVIAQKILDARKNLRGFKRITDLREVEGIDDQLYAVLKRTARVTPRVPAEFKVSYRVRGVRDLQERRGYQDGTYPGSPWKAYNRLFASYGQNVSAGIITEKDPGEQRLNDFVAGFLSIRSKKPSLKLIGGDYSVEYGQGVTVWRSLGFSKSLDVILPARKSPRGIAPYSSAEENNFYRGAAAVVTLLPIEVSGFYSYKRIDASVDSVGQITSAYGFGMHRTESELRRRRAVKEEVAGGRVQFALGNSFRLGSTYHMVRFEKPFLAKRLYDFSGHEARILGIDYDLLWRGINLFGEWARSHTGALGGISGAQINFAKGSDFVVSVRNYPRDFLSLHGFAFGERNGATQNEFGIYTGLRLRVAPSVRFSAYYDQFRFPWRTATIPFPIHGKDFLLAAEVRPVRKFMLEFKYKSETKGDAISTVDALGRSVVELADRTQRNGRMTATFDVARELRLRGRVELVKVEYSAFADGGEGILLYQDFRWKPTRQLTIDARLIFFDTDSYDTRIYEFESDLRGTLLNPALYGRGRRWYTVAQYSLFNGVNLSAKYSETYRDDVKKIGSGPDEILGNVIHRLSVQIDIRL